MSWLISRALMEAYANSPCSPGLVEAFSADCSPVGEPCALLNRMDTPQPFLRNGKTMDFSRLSQSGVTCAVLKASHGAALLTWFREDFLARTSALRGRARELTERAPVCGVSFSESYARFDPDTHMWKTAQRSLLGDSHECLQILPRSGRMSSGALLERTIKVPGTNASDCGLLPTLTVHGNNNRAGLTEKSGDGLATVLRKLPTMTLQDAKNNGGPSEARRNTPPLNSVIGGPLNPEWCEWFMGWPIGWTGLQPLATDRFQLWLVAHGKG